MNRPGQLSTFDMRARSGWVRLRTLVALRWIAIGGQITAVLVATFWLGFDLPIALCAILISASASFNIVLQMVLPIEKRLPERGTLGSLFFDLAQLVGMLMATGGLGNPFAMLILAPVTVAATALQLHSALWLGLSALISVPLMAWLYIPLTTFAGGELIVPLLYRYGIGAALVIGLVFLGVYARRVAVEGYAMSQALSASQLALAREQRLSAIGGMAAAAAHELGTPLATIKLAAAELGRDLEDQPELAEDAALILREVERCGAIMADLAKGGRDDAHLKRAPVSAVIYEAASPHMDRGKRLIVRIDGALEEEIGPAQPTIFRSPELVHGLRNAIQNAVDFAASSVWIDVGLVDGGLWIRVGDDGPGFRPEILPRLGEPYISTRGRGKQKVAEGEYEGMGLGLFIARTLLERTGARLSFANGTDRRKKVLDRRDLTERHPPGAIIEIRWPPGALIAPASEARGALGPNRRFDE